MAASNKRNSPEARRILGAHCGFHVFGDLLLKTHFEPKRMPRKKGLGNQYSLGGSVCPMMRL